jgi:MFS family permease
MSLRTFFVPISVVVWYEVGGGLFALPPFAVLPDVFMERLEITEQEISTLNVAYFLTGMISPLVGGVLMDKFGSAGITIFSNAIVTIGAVLRLLANSPSLFVLLLFARFTVGFGLEITFFTTLEVHVKLFPDDFGFMVGVHALIFNSYLTPLYFSRSSYCGFWLTVLERVLHGLLMPVLVCFMSTVASMDAAVSINKREDYLRNEEETAESDQTRITKPL